MNPVESRKICSVEVPVRLYLLNFPTQLLSEGGECLRQRSRSRRARETRLSLLGAAAMIGAAYLDGYLPNRSAAASRALSMYVSRTAFRASGRKVDIAP